jgi:hypothetical protein
MTMMMKKKKKKYFKTLLSWTTEHIASVAFLLP